MSRPRIACTLGDPAGVGPDLVLRTLADAPPDAEILLIGDPALWSARAERLGLDLDPAPFARPCGREPSDEIRPGHPTPACGQIALASLRTAVELAEAGEVDAIVTAPLNKDLVARVQPRFRGHTEWLAERAGVTEPTMLFAAPRQEGVAAGADIALLSTHWPMLTALALVRTPTVARTLGRIDRQWAETFGRRPRIGLAALNPHGGEAGRLGTEESRVLSPAVRAAREEGVEVSGPWPADSIFLRPGIDLILALYHDQGTIMAKRAPWPTVNVTLGLPYVRTSPDHGTAYDRAATGDADPAATAAAIELAVTLARRATAD